MRKLATSLFSIFLENLYGYDFILYFLGTKAELKETHHLPPVYSWSTPVSNKQPQEQLHAQRLPLLNVHLVVPTYLACSMEHGQPPSR